MMTKLEYLRILESILKVHLNRREVDEIMRDYAEYFVEGARQGKSDYDTAYSLGDPREVANQIISESLGRAGDYAAETKPSNLNKTAKAPGKTAGETVAAVGSGLGKLGRGTAKVLLVLLLLCVAPFILGAALFVLGMVAAVIVTLFGGVALFGSVILGALVLIITTCLCVGTLPVSAVICLFLISIGLIAASLLCLCFTIWLIRWVWKGTVWCCRRLYYWIARKPMPEPQPVQVPPTPTPVAEPAPAAVSASQGFVEREQQELEQVQQETEQIEQELAQEEEEWIEEFAPPQPAPENAALAQQVNEENDRPCPEEDVKEESPYA